MGQLVPLRHVSLRFVKAGEAAKFSGARGAASDVIIFFQPMPPEPSSTGGTNGAFVFLLDMSLPRWGCTG
jgi:hypothetical protein